MKRFTVLLICGLALSVCHFAVAEKKGNPPDVAPGTFSEFYGGLVTVRGNQSAGSAFIMDYHGTSTLITNNHVLGGIKDLKLTSLGNKEVRCSNFRISSDRDLALATVSGRHNCSFPVMDSLDGRVKIGDAVVVLGNSFGRGVATEIVGRVLGIGPKTIEVDAKFVSGNSGSPIVHVDSGLVIGIATYTHTESPSGSDSQSEIGRTRWFGHRLDTAKKWEPAKWSQFQREHELLDNILRQSEVLETFLSEIVAHNGFSINRYADSYEISQLLIRFKRKTDRRLSPVERHKTVLALLDSVMAETDRDIQRMRINEESFTLEYHKSLYNKYCAQRARVREQLERLAEETSILGRAHNLE